MSDSSFPLNFDTIPLKLLLSQKKKSTISKFYTKAKIFRNIKIDKVETRNKV